MTPERFPLGAILGLGITQIIGYGSLYYSFSILAPDMARDFDWSVEWVFAVLSAALLVGGLVAPWLGRWIDRFGAGKVMTFGTLAAAMALIACALAPDRTTFTATLIAVEVSANLVQYGAAFALLVQIGPAVAQRSITYLTLIAGFASTIFWPITSVLHAHLAWQSVYLVFAGLNLLVCLPIHAWLAHTATQRTKNGGAQKATNAVAGSLSPDARKTGFILMVTAFALQSLVGSAVLVHMVPLLSGLGLGASAALVGTLFGPAQVASRLINMVLGKDLPPLMLATIAATLMAVSGLVLAVTSPATMGAMIFAALFGFGNGLFSIVSGTLPLSLFGSEGYGRLQGKVMSARLIVSASAPFVFALAMSNLGTLASIVIISGIGVAAVAAFVLIGRVQRRR